MRTLLKILVAAAAMLAIACATAYAVYIFITRDAVLDENRLTDYSRSITVCSENGKEITSASPTAKRRSVQLCDLADHTKDAFICSEDRTFYSHSGLNYKRMLKALITNISSRSFSQGASTISQQLIKNTHLSGDKTITRKLKEIKLTKKLEKRYSKDQILEMYLNTIYFGHNCYGLENAARFYFDTTADKLTLEQSATLAGLLASPNNYSPFKNPEKCLKRRNTVLKCMLECGKISERQYKDAANSRTDAIAGGHTATNDYIAAVFDELDEIGFDNAAVLSGCKIMTYMDEELQREVEKIDAGCDCAAIITSQSGGVRAYRSDIRGAKRQPGSTIKPLLVYAPAIEENLICPATKILDEKINFGGYSPENHDKKYHGYVSVTESVAKSYNIPAVKTLNALTIGKADEYAKKMNIALCDEEKNLSLALGGMKYGLSLKELCEKYRAFAGGGSYESTRFIKKIIKDGKSVYSADSQKVKVFSKSTASLVNDMLKESVLNGTAKRLAQTNTDIAAKTGTCGNACGNTDAYCIAYTSADCIGIWLGSKNNAPLNISAGNDSCEIAAELIKKMYRDGNLPRKIDTTSGTKEIDIDREEYNENNRIIAADAISPPVYKVKIKVPLCYEPKEASTRFSSPQIKTPNISVKNNTILIELCHTKYYAYLIKRQNKRGTAIIYDGPWTEKIYDTPDDGIYTYTVIPYYDNGREIYGGTPVTLPAVNVNGKGSPQKIIPPR